MVARRDFQQGVGLVCGLRLKNCSLKCTYAKVSTPNSHGMGKPRPLEKGKHQVKQLRGIEEATTDASELQYWNWNEYFPSPLWKWAAKMRALHEETVARATRVEFASKLPPKANRLFERLWLGAAEGVHQTHPKGTCIKVKIITVEIAAL